MGCLTLILGLCTVSVLNAQSQITDANSRMGYGFFLPKHDMLGQLTGGAKIFNNLDPSCIVTIPNNKLRRETTFYSNTQSFFSAIATRTGVSAELKGPYTMGATFNAKSNSISSSEYEASGASLKMYSHVNDEVLSANCVNTLDLNPNLKAAFEALPLEVKNPHYRSSWYEYENLLKTYGSHLVSTTYFGALVEQFNFAKSSKKYSQLDIESRVCADFLGPTQYGKLNVSACTGMEFSQIQRSTHLEMSSKFTALGGTLEARTALLMDRSDTNVVNFLNSATIASAIGYRFIGLWSVFQSRYIGTTHYAKAKNLDYFYRGFLNTGCGYKTDSRSGFALRKFERAADFSVNRPSYKCHIPPKGCNKDSDCQTGGAIHTQCYCYGDSCVDYTSKKIAGKTIYEPYIQYSEKGSTWDGINNSCNWKFFKCNCDSSWDGGWRTLWSSENHLYKSNRRK